MKAQSYTSVNPVRSWIGDFRNLARGAARRRETMAAGVEECLRRNQELREMLEPELRRELKGLDLLEIGPGQVQGQMWPLMVRGNRVVGIDLDVAPRGLDLGAYIAMARKNGLNRLIKTIGRKAMGFDRAFQREMARQLGVPRLPTSDVRQMNATAMTFPDASFDAVYSFDVFEHLPDPEPILANVRRVLRPGGVFHTLLHPFTAEDGVHDLRIIIGEREGIPSWAHLRPAHVSEVRRSAWLNEIRNDRWRAMAEAQMPGARIVLTPPPNLDHLASELAKLRAAGELAEYSDEELLCGRLVILWRKPG